MNQEKTKCVIVETRNSLKENKIGNLKTKNYKFERVENFKYLGVILNEDNKQGREEKPTRCHSMVYCTYNMLSMFRALLCPSSGAQDYMCIITAYGVQ